MKVISAANGNWPRRGRTTWRRAGHFLPVVIDGTAEVAAEVPEEFMRVQWTRLLNGIASAEFSERVKRLLEVSICKGGNGGTCARETLDRAGGLRQEALRVDPAVVRRRFTRTHGASAVHRFVLHRNAAAVVSLKRLRALIKSPRTRAGSAVIEGDDGGSSARKKPHE